MNDDLLVLNLKWRLKSYNCSHGSKVLAGEAKYLKASLGTRPCDGANRSNDLKSSEQFLVLLYNVLNPSMTSTGAKEIRHLDPTSLI